MSEGPPSPKRLRLDMDDLGSLNKEELIEKLRELGEHVSYLQANQRGSLEKDDGDDKEGEDKKQQNQDSSRRENTLVLRLTKKEQELQDCMNQIAEMKASQTQNSAQLRNLLLDPAVNLVFQRMAKEMDDCKEKLKQTQNELSAWKFTADSQMGKRLMAKCRMLLQENEDLGKMISSGRTSKLEAEIALQKTMVTEMKTNQDEMNEFVSELEEDVEGMQSMIYVLQQQLKDARDNMAALEAENQRLRAQTQQAQDKLAQQSTSLKHEAPTPPATSPLKDSSDPSPSKPQAPSACNSNSSPTTADQTSVMRPQETTEKCVSPDSKARTTDEAADSKVVDSKTPSSSPAKAQALVTVKTEPPSPNKRTGVGAGSDDIDGATQQQGQTQQPQPQPNGRTSEEAVGESKKENCSTPPVVVKKEETNVTDVTLGTKTECDPLVTDTPTKGCHGDLRTDETDIRTETLDVKPLRNGGLPVTAQPAAESGK